MGDRTRAANLHSSVRMKIPGGGLRKRPPTFRYEVYEVTFTQSKNKKVGVTFKMTPMIASVCSIGKIPLR